MHHYSKILILATLSIVFSAAAQTPSPNNPPAKTAGAELPANTRLARFDPALLQPANLRAKAPDVYEVKFVTTAGDFGIKVTRAWAPNGADRFYNLILHHFYDGVAFFRVLPGFMAQFGLNPYPEVSRAIRGPRRYSSTTAITNASTRTASRPSAWSPAAWKSSKSCTAATARVPRVDAARIKG